MLDSHICHASLSLWVRCAPFVCVEDLLNTNTQLFPFEFQIGNAVAPPMAHALGRAVVDSIVGMPQHPERFDQNPNPCFGAVEVDSALVEPGSTFENMTFVPKALHSQCQKEIVGTAKTGGVQSLVWLVKGGTDMDTGDTLTYTVKRRTIDAAALRASWASQRPIRVLRNRQVHCHSHFLLGVVLLLLPLHNDTLLLLPHPSTT
jgi:hypothetical protein